MVPNLSVSLISISLIVGLTSRCFADPALCARLLHVYFFLNMVLFLILLRPGTPVSGPAEARIWGTPTGYLLGKNYLGFAPLDKVVGLVASTVQDFYARLIGSAVQKF